MISSHKLSSVLSETLHPISNSVRPSLDCTRTTRTPAFWEIPVTPWLPILVIHIRSLVKRTQSQSHKFKIAKNSNFKTLQATSHATHLLKLLDKMCKYELDPARIVSATQRTRDAGRTDGRSETNIPPTTSLCGGYNNCTRTSNLAFQTCCHNPGNIIHLSHL